jgi:hypothetical protein
MSHGALALPALVAYFLVPWWKMMVIAAVLGPLLKSMSNC